jgi:hypothetical protein
LLLRVVSVKLAVNAGPLATAWTWRPLPLERPWRLPFALRRVPKSRGHDHARQAIDGITVGDLKLPPKLVQIDLNSEMVLVRGEAAEAQLAKVTGRRTETPEQIGEEGDSRS